MDRKSEINNWVKKMRRPLILAFAFGLCNPSYSTVLNELEVRENLLCNPNILRANSLNFVLTFEGERLSISKKADYFENTLFVGTHFSIKRDPETFNTKNLLKDGDIAAISESRISSFKKVNSNTATFNSSKDLPFFTTLDCSNRVEIFTWDAFSKLNDSLPFVEGLSEANCIDRVEEEGKPYIVSLQEVFNCNRHFERSKVITLYFRKGSNQTRILNYAFSELSNRANFIEKGVITREINKSLKKVPQIIENLK